MAELDKLLASCFAAADRALAVMQASGLAAAGLLTQHSAILRVALVASALALALCVPLLVLYKLFGSEHGSIPRLDVKLTAEETAENADKKWVPGTPFPKDYVPCYDPGNLHLLGSGRMPAMTPAQVLEKVEKARVAQKEWAKSSFKQRRFLMRIIQRFILENQETICQVSARDSGKPMVDAAFGEVMVTLEKIAWLCSEGEHYLLPERRSAGIMMFYKSARVEYHPIGVAGAIVPWNYPFHNVFNPLLANLFAGNALVIKVSEYASWSSAYYGRVIDAALAAAGAPKGLVQIVTGYGEAGSALVGSGVGKLTFVGSTGVGRMVMAAAAKTLTPVVLELGGKDAFIVCDDADISQVVPVALRGAFQSCGQNCAGAERFFVQRKVYDKFVEQVAAAARKMRQGHALAPGTDSGAMCMPNQAAFVQELIDDAVKKGAQLLVGGKLPDPKVTGGQFYPPTVLAGVNKTMRITQEEVFGPVLCVAVFDSDDEAAALANDCAFGLGSNVFSRDLRRARRLGAKLEAGMTAINDFAATYMAQSLPFGGVKESGFDRFAGVEGLRGCCVPKAVVEDRFPLIRTDIPPPLQYPISDGAFAFCSGAPHLPRWAPVECLPNARNMVPARPRCVDACFDGTPCTVCSLSLCPQASEEACLRSARTHRAGIISMFYGQTVAHRLGGLGRLLRALLPGAGAAKKTN